MTESFTSPDTRRGRSTLPGALISRRFEVTLTTTVVDKADALNLSDCTTTTGRRYPGADPAGSPGSAHLISPRRTTTPGAAGDVVGRAGCRQATDSLPWRTRRSSVP